MATITKRFDPKRISLSSLYRSDELDHWDEPFRSSRRREIYGTLNLPPIEKGRLYQAGCFVSSIDGSITYPDSSDGSQVAKRNLTDPAGADSDFWVLNMLQNAMDCVITGTKTLMSAPLYRAGMADEQLCRDRESAAGSPLPLLVVLTKGGDSFPFEHPLLASRNQQIVVASTEQGKEYLASRLPEHVQVMPCGVDRVETALLNRKLYDMGMRRVLVESPSWCRQLMKQGELDELFLTTSSVVIGDHSAEQLPSPLAMTSRILSVHIHPPGFLFVRYQFN